MVWIWTLNSAPPAPTIALALSRSMAPAKDMAGAARAGGGSHYVLEATLRARAGRKQNTGGGSHSVLEATLRARLSLIRERRSVRIRRSFWILAARDRMREHM